MGSAKQEKKHHSRRPRSSNPRQSGGEARPILTHPDRRGSRPAAGAPGIHGAEQLRGLCPTRRSKTTTIPPKGLGLTEISWRDGVTSWRSRMLAGLWGEPTPEPRDHGGRDFPTILTCTASLQGYWGYGRISHRLDDLRVQHLAVLPSLLPGGPSYPPEYDCGTVVL